ncbi:MAG: tetratricopeptide repeat protein [Terriglobales bacterium]
MSKLAKLSLMAVLLALAIPAFGQVGGIQGKATNQQGQPIAGGTVVFLRQDISGKYEVKTNKKGHYGHYGLPLGEYDIVLYGPDGKKIYEWRAVRNSPGSPTTVDFDMKKLDSKSYREAHMTAAQRAAQQKQQEAAAKQNKQLGTINGLMKQNQQFAAAGQWAQAITTMQQAQQLGQGLKLTKQSQAAIMANLGNDYNGAKQYPQAITAYQQALALDPTDQQLAGNVYTNLGTALVHQGKMDEAVQDFDKAATLNPANAKTAYYNEGAILYNSGKMDAAAAAFTKAIQADPNYAQAWYEKGMSLVGKGTINPKTGATTYPAGTAQAFRMYLKLAPNGPNAASAKALLQGITGKINTNYNSH